MKNLGALMFERFVTRLFFSRALQIAITCLLIFSIYRQSGGSLPAAIDTIIGTISKLTFCVTSKFLSLFGVTISAFGAHAIWIGVVMILPASVGNWHALWRKDFNRLLLIVFGLLFIAWYSFTTYLFIVGDVTVEAEVQKNLLRSYFYNKLLVVFGLYTATFIAGDSWKERWDVLTRVFGFVIGFALLYSIAGTVV